MKDYERAVAALRREFAAGLEERLTRLRAALGRLEHDDTPEARQAFHLPAHSLKGTAAAYQADELVSHAARLTIMGRRWLDMGATPAAERAEAAVELAALEAAIVRYRQRTGNDS